MNIPGIAFQDYVSLRETEQAVILAFEVATGARVPAYVERKPTIKVEGHHKRDRAFPEAWLFQRRNWKWTSLHGNWEWS